MDLPEPWQLYPMPPEQVSAIQQYISRRTSSSVVEHAIMMPGGDMRVRNHYEIEALYPLADWISQEQRFGGKVYRRTVIVVEDWAEVER